MSPGRLNRNASAARHRRILSILAWLVLGSALGAQELGPSSLPELPDVRQRPRNELTGYEARPLDGLAMARLCCLVSGLAPDALDPYLRRLDALTIRARAAVAASPLPPGEALLIFLHGSDGVFRRYQATQTRLDTLLDTGNFNCVSSALLYLLVGRSLGLEISGVGTADHAFCAVRADGKSLDAETTIAYGYDPGRRQDFRDGFGKLTGFVWVPPGNYAMRKMLDDQHFAALVLQNLLVDAEERRDTAAAIGLAWDFAALVGLPDARPLLATAYHNRASWLNDQRRYPDALALILNAESRIGVSPDSRQMMEGIAGNYLNEDLNRRDWAAAHSHLAFWAPRMGATFATMTVNLFRLESQDRLRTGGWMALQSWLLGQTAPPELPAGELDAAWDMGVTAETARITRGGDWEAGLAFLAALDVRLGHLPGALRARASCEHNIVSAYHNRFASLANAKKDQEALAVIEEALARFPDNALLRRDKVLLNGR